MSSIFTIISVILVIIMLSTWIVRYSEDHRDKRMGLAGITILLSASGFLGWTGIMRDFTKFPPPMAFFMLTLIAAITAVSFSPWGRRMAYRTPLRLLIGMQSFRVLPEIMLHLAWLDSLAPIQMTFHGNNPDILTAIAAALIAVAWAKISCHRRVAWAFTTIGLLLLFNILTISVLSTPMPFRLFHNEPANTFIANFPYVWLPGIHVFTALMLHILTIRHLLLHKVK